MTIAISFNPQIGAPPSLEQVAVAQLAVDARYQRGTDNLVSKNLIRRIAQGWDWRLCQPLGCARGEDGAIRIVDGQHRWEAARLRGDIAYLPCIITRYADIADEAAAFVALNRQRKPLGAVDLFKASLASGDSQALGVMAAITSSGLQLAPHSNYTAWKPGMIYCIAAVARAWARRGPQITEAALTALAVAFHGQVLHHAADLLSGLFDVFSDPFSTSVQFDQPRFVAMLGGRTERQWLNAAHKIKGDGFLSQAQSVAKAMLDAHRADLGALPVAPAVPALQQRPPQEVRPRLSYEELLEGVKSGAITVHERVDFRKPDPDMTLGGIASGML